MMSPTIGNCDADDGPPGTRSVCRNELSPRPSQSEAPPVGSGGVVLVLTSVHQGLHPAQWLVVGVYVFYLLPYIAISYYLHYGFPLLGVKTLLVLWAIDRLLPASFPRFLGCVVRNFVGL